MNDSACMIQTNWFLSEQVKPWFIIPDGQIKVNSKGG